MEQIHKMFTLGLEDVCKICDKVNIDGIILLKGNLAIGKTTLVKKLAEHIGIKEEITSPTFSIMQCYEDRLYHYDIYQIKTEGFIKQGLYENLGLPGLHVIEWGDNELEKLLQRMKYKYTCINICNANEEDKRCYEVYNHVQT